MERTITLTELKNSGTNTWSVKDDSPRGCHTAYTAEIKPGDMVVINNYFTTVTEDASVKMIDIDEFEKRATEDIDTGDHADRLNDYRDSSSYICDAITEIADSDTSIYYSDILEFIKENPEALADCVSEGLYEVGHGQEYDLYKHGQAAEFMTIERDIYEHLKGGLMVAAVDFIKYDLKLEEVPEELLELLDEWTDEADNNDRMDDIPDKIRDYLEELNGEEVDE